MKNPLKLSLLTLVFLGAWISVAKSLKTKIQTPTPVNASFNPSKEKAPTWKPFFSELGRSVTIVPASSKGLKAMPTKDAVNRFKSWKDRQEELATMQKAQRIRGESSSGPAEPLRKEPRTPMDDRSDRGEDEAAETSPTARARSTGGSLANSNGDREAEDDSEEPLGSFEYRVKAFYPGFTGSGALIRDANSNSVQSIVVGAPDFVASESSRQRDRILPLGHKGSIVLEVVGGYVKDDEGPDFIVFENPLLSDNGEISFPEKALVSVSWSGKEEDYRYFDCDSTNYPFEGCAGTHAVNYSPELDLTEVGGDAFDLSEIGVEKIRYIRIEDTGDSIGVQEGYEGFDLDAIALIHGKRFK